MSQTDPSTLVRHDVEDDRLGPQKPRLVERLRSIFGLGGASIRDDIQDALEDSADGDFSAQERTMMKNVLAMHEVRVFDVMVPRADIFSVSLSMTLSEVLAMFRTAGHSRLPVYGTTLDDPRGMIHVRDLVDYIAGAEEPVSPDVIAPTASDGPEPAPDKMVRSLGTLDLTLPLSEAKILRPVLFVPPSMPALDLLVKMQATRTHMALVIDEYGGTEGLTSIEDIVEMIVGDIEDEHDADEKPMIERGADGSFLVDARASLEELSDTLGIDLGATDEAEDIETIGGLVTLLAGHVPVRGEIVPHGLFEFEVLDADPRRVKRLKVHTRPQGTPIPDAA